MNKNFVDLNVQIIELYYNVFDFYIESFSDKIITDIESEGKFENVSITMLRKENNKKINFYYSQGFNIDDEFICLMQFSIETLKTEKIKREKFYIQDYNVLIEKPYIPILTSSRNFEDKKEELIIIFKQVLEILNELNLRRILFTHDWIEVPINWGTFK